MRLFILVSAALLIATPAMAHCGKPHPNSKDKGSSSRIIPKPE